MFTCLRQAKKIQQNTNCDDDFIYSIFHVVLDQIDEIPLAATRNCFCLLSVSRLYPQVTLRYLLIRLTSAHMCHTQMRMPKMPNGKNTKY